MNGIEESDPLMSSIIQGTVLRFVGALIGIFVAIMGIILPLAHSMIRSGWKDAIGLPLTMLGAIVISSLIIGVTGLILWGLWELCHYWATEADEKAPVKKKAAL